MRTVFFIVVEMYPVRAPVFKWLKLENARSFILAEQRTSRTFYRHSVCQHPLAELGPTVGLHE